MHGNKQTPIDKAENLDVWGTSMLNQCTSRLRKRRERDASKKRRRAAKHEIREQLKGL